MVTKTRPVWGIAQAKARLSEILERAKAEPQLIERRGRTVGVVVDISHYGEAEKRATLGSAEHRMRAFLEAAAAVRDRGRVKFVAQRRKARKSPVGVR